MIFILLYCTKFGKKEPAHAIVMGSSLDLLITYLISRILLQNM